MDEPSSSIRDLARRLLLLSRTSAEPHEHEAKRICEILRISLTRFAGADGFTSLLGRALVLASAEVPLLKRVKMGTDGRLEGLELLEQTEGEKASDAAVALTAYLLWLLVTFIGEALAIKLVRETWPEASLATKKE